MPSLPPKTARMKLFWSPFWVTATACSRAGPGSAGSSVQFHLPSFWPMAKARLVGSPLSLPPTRTAPSVQVSTVMPFFQAATAGMERTPSGKSGRSVTVPSASSRKASPVGPSAVTPPTQRRAGLASMSVPVLTTHAPPSAVPRGRALSSTVQVLALVS